MIVLLSLGKLSIYEQVLALHDRKGTLILVLENWTDPDDVALLVQAACHGWSALNECEICVVYRRAGDRPRGISTPRKPTPRKPPIPAPAFVPRSDGGGFQPEGSPLWWITAPMKKREPT